MAFSPDTFLANINAKDGLARPNRYEVILPIPQYIDNFVSQSIFEKILNVPNSIITDISDGINSVLNGDSLNTGTRTANPSITRYLSLQCESAELPGKTIATKDVKVYGPTYKVPYQTLYSETNLTFLCTNEFYERKLFERWAECIMPSDTNNLRYAKDDATRYMTNIKIVQYDEFIKQIFAIELIDAYPISIASQQLSWSDDNFHRLGIQFAYQKYRVIYNGTYDVGAAIGSLFGAKASRVLNSAQRGFGNTIGGTLGSIRL